MIFNRLLVSTALCLLPAGIALAQQNFPAGVTISDSDFSTADLFVTDVSVLDGNLCIGNSCVPTETFTNDTLVKLSSSNLSILFDDASGVSFPDRDWRMIVNDVTQTSLGGLERFSIEDVTAGTIPFTVEGDAPANALYINEFGRVGFGTSMPQADLHIVSTAAPRVRFEEAGATPYIWDLAGTDDLFTIQDTTTATNPLVIEAAAPDFAINIESNGNVGIGTDNPGAPLTVSSPGGFTFFRIEALGAAPNTSADMTFTSGPAGSGGEYRINVVDGDGPEMRVDGAGFVTAFAGFRVGSTNLNVPDYVFEPDYALRPLAEVASFIQQNKHLPDVPSAGQVAEDGLDMTQMQMTLLKKVEELTLYTLDQEQTIAEQRAELDDLRVIAGVVESLQERVDRMEKLGKYK